MRLESYPRPAGGSGLAVRLEHPSPEGLERAARRGVRWVVLTHPAHEPAPVALLAQAHRLSLEPLVALQTDYVGDLAGGLTRRVEELGRAGARYLWAYELANRADRWRWSEWAQPDLVARFAAALLPLLERTAEAGLYPTLPPLQPGGDYWDTVWLEALLGELERLGRKALFDRLAVAAVVEPAGRPLHWGEGGPARWPEARPYHTPSTSQDQCGFHLFEWYDAVIRRKVGHSLPILGVMGRTSPTEAAQIGELLARRSLPGVLFCICLAEGEVEVAPGALAGDGAGSAEEAAPLVPEGPAGMGGPGPVPTREGLPVTEGPPEEAVRHQLLSKRPDPPSGGQARPAAPPASPDAGARPAAPADAQPDRSLYHYLLLPQWDWGVSEWHWRVVAGYVRKFRPVTGFDPQEARLARHVTIVGGTEGVGREVEQSLRLAGCRVERLGSSDTQHTRVVLEEMVRLGKRFREEAS